MIFPTSWAGASAPASGPIHEVGGNMATVNPASTQPKTTTAEDTLQRKSRDASVISGGHLVAKALKNEGVDTIFTLCGGHIIDIYDGCVDEGIRIIDVRHEQVAAHAADGYARQTGQLGCVVTTAGPGCTNAVTGIATAFRSETPVLHIGGPGCARATQNGFAARPAARRDDGADHQVCSDRSDDRTYCRHDCNGRPRLLCRGLWAGLSRNSTRYSGSGDRGRQRDLAPARNISGLEQINRRSARYRAARRYADRRGAPRYAVGPAGVDRSRSP